MNGEKVESAAEEFFKRFVSWWHREDYGDKDQCWRAFQEGAAAIETAAGRERQLYNCGAGSLRDIARCEARKKGPCMTCQLGSLQADLATAQSKLAACNGKYYYSSDPADESHESQIERLRQVLTRSTVTLICRICDFKLAGPYMPPSLCAKCGGADTMVADVVLEAEQRVREKCAITAISFYSPLNGGPHDSLIGRIVSAIRSRK